jgi:hypothetical protein
MLAEAGQAAQLQTSMMQNAAISQEMEGQNALRKWQMSGGDINSADAPNQMLKMGVPFKAVQSFVKTGLEQRKLGGEVTKQNLDITQRIMGDLANNPSNENITANVQDLLKANRISSTQAQSLLTQALNVPVDKRASLFTNMAIDAKTRYDKTTISAGEQARLKQAQSHFDIGQQGAGQALTDASGNVTVLDKQGNVMRQLGNIGKPSATFEKTAALQKQQGRDLGLAITELESATKDKGLIDQSTGSGIGRLVDVSAGAFGSATPGAIAIAKLKPIADMALKMVPRFEGPQSDKDTQSYKEAAGQLADPSLPTDLRKAAGKEVLRLMKARKNQFVNEAMANEGIGAGAGVDTSNPLLK